MQRERGRRQHLEEVRRERVAAMAWLLQPKERRCERRRKGDGPRNLWAVDRIHGPFSFATSPPSPADRPPGFATSSLDLRSHLQLRLRFVFYITPTDAMEKAAANPTRNHFRLGGLVLEGSVVHPRDGVRHHPLFFAGVLRY